MTSAGEALDTTERLAEILAGCAAALFEAHGADTQGPGPLAEEFDEGLCAIVGLTGKNYHGSVLLLCPEEVLAATHPGRLMMRDWVGELANQLAGRLKHALWHHGAGLVYVTPPSIMNSSFVNSRARAAHLVSMSFRVNGVSIGIWLDGELAEDLVLEPADVEPCVAEGGLVVFD